MQVLEKEVSTYTDIDFKHLNMSVMFATILMIPIKSKEASLVAKLTKDIAMRLAFDNKDSLREKYGNIYGHIFNYVVWFAHVLLYCEEQDRTILIKLFL